VNIRYVLIPFLLQGLVMASPDQAEKRLQTAVNEVLEVANSVSNQEALATALRPVLQKHLSFEAMTRRAVGPGWRQFSKSQATQFFTTLIIRTYSSKFTPGEHPEVQYKAAMIPAAGRVEIPTSLLYQGSRYNVTYRLEQAEGWKVTDVLIEGVSLVANYRSQFDEEFKKGGANAVVGALSQSVAKK
jgi:phospholipid transport system substrate-binding protein